MPNPGSILGQIGESFETLAEDVARETAAVPKDIVGNVMETAGLSTGKKGNSQKSNASQKPQTSGEQEKQQAEQQIKQAIARSALEDISGKNKKQEKEPSVWEKIQKEEEQKKELEKKKKEAAAKQSLPQSKGKRPRGDLYGIKAKKASAEMSRNVRQD